MAKRMHDELGIATVWLTKHPEYVAKGEKPL